MEPDQKKLEKIRKKYPDFRWEKEDNRDGDQGSLLGPSYRYSGVPFRFADLFAGIGGFRCGLTSLGGECVYTSEWDKFSLETYKNWYGADHIEEEDFRTVDYEEIPDHDILCGGFPCQPFSLAGVSSKNFLGRSHGFEDEKQGNLFFSILDAVNAKQPPVLFFENVKNLRSHDEGRTWEVIHTSLEEAGYHVFDKIIDAAFCVPQHRERIFIVCFRKDLFGGDRESLFRFPDPPVVRKPLGSILEKNPDKEKYMLTEGTWKYLDEHKQKHSEAGHGFGYGIIEPGDREEGVTRTMTARYHKDGSEILIREKGWKNPRKLTPGEAALLQGFDDKYAAIFGHENGFPHCVSDTQAYRQFGNAVVPGVIEAIAENIQSTLIEKVLLKL